MGPLFPSLTPRMKKFLIHAAITAAIAAALHAKKKDGDEPSRPDPPGAVQSSVYR